MVKRALQSVRCVLRTPVAAVVFVGCTIPQLRVEADPPEARILVDGEERGTGDVLMRQPYYGTARIEVVPPAQTAGDSLRPAHRLVPLGEPFTPWLFPIDLLFELATHPWRSDHRVRISAAPRPALTPGTQHPPKTDELRERARRLRTAR